MGEFDTSRTRDISGPSPAHREPQHHVTTAPERQQQALAEAERDVDASEHNVNELARTSDPRAWESRRAEAQRALASSKDALEKAKQEQAAPAAVDKLEQRIATLSHTLADAKAPTAYRA